MDLRPFTTRVIKVINLDDLDKADYEVKYYRYTSFNGLTTYSSEIDLGINDKIILDDYSIYRLEDKLRYIFPAALYVRLGLKGEGEDLNYKEWEEK